MSTEQGSLKGKAMLEEKARSERGEIKHGTKIEQSICLMDSHPTPRTCKADTIRAFRRRDCITTEVRG